jgi:hypothetical protein
MAEENRMGIFSRSKDDYFNWDIILNLMPHRFGNGHALLIGRQDKSKTTLEPPMYVFECYPRDVNENASDLKAQLTTPIFLAVEPQFLWTFGKGAWSYHRTIKIIAASNPMLLPPIFQNGFFQMLFVPAILLKKNEVSITKAVHQGRMDFENLIQQTESNLLVWYKDKVNYHLQESIEKKRNELFEKALEKK